MSWIRQDCDIAVYVEFYDKLSKLPTDSLNPWSVGPLPPTVRPDKDIENMEYGGRFSCFLGGVDFSLMALRTWSKIPEIVDDHGNHLGNALAGLDWYPGADWNVSVQYYQTFGEGEEAALATLRVSKALLNNSLTLSTFAYADVKDLGVFNRLSADWAATDQIHVLIGYDYFYDDAGMFKRYEHNSEVWFKLKYCY